jgi:hypothetical protein
MELNFTFCVCVHMLLHVLVSDIVTFQVATVFLGYPEEFNIFFNLVRLYCIGLVDLYHLFYKCVVGPLGLPPPLYAVSPRAGPLRLQGRQPIRILGGAASPRCRLHWRRLPWPPALGGSLPPI